MTVPRRYSKSANCAEIMRRDVYILEATLFIIRFPASCTTFDNTTHRGKIDSMPLSWCQVLFTNRIRVAWQHAWTPNSLFVRKESSIIIDTGAPLHWWMYRNLQKSSRGTTTAGGLPVCTFAIQTSRIFYSSLPEGPPSRIICNQHNAMGTRSLNPTTDPWNEVSHQRPRTTPKRAQDKLGPALMRPGDCLGLDASMLVSFRR